MATSLAERPKLPPFIESTVEFVLFLGVQGGSGFAKALLLGRNSQLPAQTVANNKIMIGRRNVLVIMSKPFL